MSQCFKWFFVSFTSCTCPEKSPPTISGHVSCTWSWVQVLLVDKYWAWSFLEYWAGVLWCGSLLHAEISLWHSISSTIVGLISVVCACLLSVSLCVEGVWFWPRQFDDLLFLSVHRAFFLSSRHPKLLCSVIWPLLEKEKPKIAECLC